MALNRHENSVIHTINLFFRNNLHHHLSFTPHLSHHYGHSQWKNCCQILVLMSAETFTPSGLAPSTLEFQNHSQKGHHILSTYLPLEAELTDPMSHIKKI